MTTTLGPQTVRFSVDVELTNREDLFRADAGLISPAAVRRTRGRGIVDSSLPRLIIPASVAQYLGLEKSCTALVRYADGHTAERDIVKGIYLAYGGRDSVFSAIVEPNGESIVIGAIVLEDLDFMVDSVAQRLVPRGPKQIVSEVE